MRKYVVDLETAKKLKDYLPEGGGGEFWWCKLSKGIPPASFSLNDWFLYLKKDKGSLEKKYSPKYMIFYPAPILEEMLGLLPKVKATRDYIERDGNKVKKELRFDWVMTGFGNDIEYINFPGYNKLEISGGYEGFNSIGAHNVNPATAAAKLYMYLAENGYLDKTNPLLAVD